MAARTAGSNILRQVTLSRSVGRQWRNPAVEVVRRKRVLEFFLSTSRCFSAAQDQYIVKSPHPDVQIPQNVPLTQFVTEHFPKYGDAVAMVNGITGESFTYNQVHDKIVKVASSLVKMGIKKGDVVTLISPNCPEFAIIWMAVNQIGAVLSPLNPLYTANELTHTVNHSKSQLVVTIDELVPIAKESQKSCPNIKGIVTFGQSGGCIRFRDMMEDNSGLCPASVDIDTKEDMAQLPYSSGTTGLPKGVMLTHFNLIANLEQLLSPHVMDYKTQEDTLIGVLPFFHIYGGILTLLAGLRHGVKIITLPKFDPETFLSTIQNHQGTFSHIVPPLVLFLAKHELVPKYDLSSLHTLFTAAAPIGEEMMNAALERLKNPNLKFRQGYGLTETSPLTHTTPHGSKKIAAIGVPGPNIEAKIVDLETGEALGPGKEGELCVTGPNVMKGYFDNPTATANTIKNGWFHTGDIGYYDDENYFYVSDRLKELIKVKGFQVAPAELEALVNTHPAIADVAVIGIPDERSGELPRAYCVLKAGMSATEDDVKNFLKDKVAAFKQLSGGVEFRPSIPKTASGKIQRRILKAEYIEATKK